MVAILFLKENEKFYCENIVILKVVLRIIFRLNFQNTLYPNCFRHSSNYMILVNGENIKSTWREEPLGDIPIFTRVYFCPCV